MNHKNREDAQDLDRVLLEASLLQGLDGRKLEISLSDLALLADLAGLPHLAKHARTLTPSSADYFCLRL